ncbi:6602_t:CDS:2, partial [Scutellospora calospora]
SLEAKSDPNRLVKKLLKHADFLVENAISDVYRKRLVKAWSMFVKFTKRIGCESCSTSVTMIAVYLAWLEISRQSSELAVVIGIKKAVSRDAEDNAPFFLSKIGKKMMVSSVSAVVKRFADYANLQGKFTAHSLRIEKATAAMRDRLTIEQIQIIGG